MEERVIVRDYEKERKEEKGGREIDGHAERERERISEQQFFWRGGGERDCYH